MALLTSVRERVGKWATSGALFSIVTAFATLIAGLVFVLSSSNFNSERRAREDSVQSTLEANTARVQLEALENEKNLRRQLDEMIARLRSSETAKVGTQSGMSLADRASLDQVIDGQKQLATRLSALEGALMNDPIKAMSVPMLKKDLEDLQDREKSDAASVRAEDDRFATFQQWFMALIVGTIISILALAATIVGMTVKFGKKVVPSD